MIPWTKTSEEWGKLPLSRVQQSLNVERSVIEGISLNLTIFWQKLLSRNESNIDLELLYVGLTTVVLRNVYKSASNEIKAASNEIQLKVGSLKIIFRLFFVLLLISSI